MIGVNQSDNQRVAKENVSRMSALKELLEVGHERETHG